MTNLYEQLEKKSFIKARKRVGRGIGSGKGKTCGRGHKGQKSRSGVAVKGFEGGQMPIYRRLPKRGFNSMFADFNVVTFKTLESFIASKKLTSDIKIADLKKLGLIDSSSRGIKLLASGELKSKFNIEVNRASKGAISALEGMGGKVKLVD